MSLDEVEREPGVVAPRVAWIDDSNDVPNLIFPEPIRPLPLSLGGATLDHGSVDLADRSVTKLASEPIGSFARPGEQDDPRRRPVEPVDKPDEDVTGLGISRLQIVASQVNEAGLARLVSLGQKSGRFVDSETMIVFEKDFQHYFHRPPKERSPSPLFP